MELLEEKKKRSIKKSDIFILMTRYPKEGQPIINIKLGDE